MVVIVANGSSCSTKLPNELERTIFLLASRKPHELINLMKVARRVRAWIEPILYRKIIILSKAQVQSILCSLGERSKIILYLYIGTSVPPDGVATLLHHCPHLVNLNLYSGSNSLRLCQFHAIVNAVNSLKQLRYLSVDPALFFQTHFAYLPDVSIFHHVTHLDLTTSDTIASGFHRLCRLTHLAMTWKMSRVATHSLLSLLQRQNLKLILLWFNDVDGPMVIRDLLKRRLDNSRIVLLRQASRWSEEMSEGFWLHAERIIAWRKEKNVTTVERPTTSEDVASTCSKAHNYQPLPWERA